MLTCKSLITPKSIESILNYRNDNIYNRHYNKTLYNMQPYGDTNNFHQYIYGEIHNSNNIRCDQYPQISPNSGYIAYISRISKSEIKLVISDRLGYNNLSTFDFKSSSAVHLIFTWINNDILQVVDLDNAVNTEIISIYDTRRHLSEIMGYKSNYDLTYNSKIQKLLISYFVTDKQSSGWNLDIYSIKVDELFTIKKAELDKNKIDTLKYTTCLKICNNKLLYMFNSLNQEL